MGGEHPRRPWELRETGPDSVPRLTARFSRLRVGRLKVPEEQDQATDKNGPGTGSALEGKGGAASTPPAAKRARGKGDGEGTRLVIVESPAKARTIAGYLGK